MVTTYSAENSLKSIYLSVVSDVLNTQVNPLITKIEKSSNNVYGKDIRLAKSYNGEYIQFVTELKNLYMQVEISEKELRVSNNSGVATFLNLMNEKLQEVIQVAGNDFSLMLFSEERDSKWLTGIADIFDLAKPLYGHERGEFPLLTPIIKEVTELNDIVIEQAIDEVESNGGRIDFIAVSRDMKYAYIEQHKNIDIVDMGGCFKALSHNGIPLVYDKSIPQGTMYLLDTSKFALHQLCDWEWLEDERGHILRKTPNKDTYTATLAKYGDLICEAPNCQAMIKLTKN